MAVIERVNERTTDREASLVDRLLAEWQTPGSDEPVIIEERPAEGQPPNHLYVVWGEWADLSSLQRSRIVMRAYERKLGADAALATQVTIAMGLTPEQARTIGLDM